MAISDWTIQEYLERARSGDATPGGGSVAALAGALAASMATMVANLTIGKKGYAEHEAECTRIRQDLARIEGELLKLAEADMVAFERLMSAYRLPRNTDPEKDLRRRAIQDAVVEAIEVPLRIARCCADVVAAAERLAVIGNKNAISDAGVAAVLGEGAAQSALLNVDINIPALKDGDGAAEFAAERAALGDGVSRMRADTMATIRRVL